MALETLVYSLLRYLEELSKLDVHEIKGSNLEQIRQCWKAVLGINDHLFDPMEYTGINIRVNAHEKSEFFGLKLKKRLYNLEDLDYTFEINDEKKDARSTIDPTLLVGRAVQDFQMTGNYFSDTQLTLKRSVILKKMEDLFALHKNLLSNIDTASRLRQVLRDCVLRQVTNVVSGELLNRSYFSCSDKILEECYDRLIVKYMEDDTTSLEDLISQTMNVYFKYSNIAILFDLEIANRLDREIQHISEIGVTFEKMMKDEEKSELHDQFQLFFTRFPVIPLLSPFVNALSNRIKDTHIRVTANNYSESSPKIKKETTQSMGHSRQPSEKVAPYLLSNNGLISCMSNIITKLEPGSVLLVRFLKIFKTYLLLLEECDDASIFSTEQCYVEVQSTVQDYLDGRMASTTFLSHLKEIYELICNPDDSFADIQMSSIHTQLAIKLFHENENIKLFAFNIWYDRLQNAVADKSSLLIWNKRIKRNYFYKLRVALKKINDLDQAAGRMCHGLSLNRYFDTWTNSLNSVRELEIKYNNVKLRRIFGSWKTKSLEKSIVLDATYERYLLRKQYNRWKLSFMESKLLFVFDQNVIAKYHLQLWKSKLDYKSQLDQRAEEVLNLKAKKTAIKLWTNRVSGTLQKVSYLENRRLKYKKVIVFEEWYNQYELRVLEKKAKESNDLHMVRYIFSRWRASALMNQQAVLILTEKSQKMLSDYFRLWFSSVGRDDLSKSFRSKSLLSRAFTSWKTSYNEKSAEYLQDVIIMKQYFKALRLRAKLKRKGSDKCLRSSLVKIKSKCEHIKQLQQVAGKLETAKKADILYKIFDRYVVVRELPLKITEANKIRDELFQRKFFESWRDRLMEINKRKESIEELYNEYVLEVYAQSKFLTWKAETEAVLLLNNKAEEFRSLVLSTKYANKWMRRVEYIAELNVICEDKILEYDTALLKKSFSRLSLKYMKFKADYVTAQNFADRGYKNKRKAIIQLWRNSLAEHQFIERQRMLSLDDDLLIDNTAGLSPLVKRRLEIKRISSDSGSEGTSFQLRTERVSPPKSTPSTSRSLSIPSTERFHRNNLDILKAEIMQVRLPSPEKPKPNLGLTSKSETKAPSIGSELPLETPVRPLRRTIENSAKKQLEVMKPRLLDAATRAARQNTRSQIPSFLREEDNMFREP